jgi:hypothetical protein
VPTPTLVDIDFDDDGIPDSSEGSGDLDGDGRPNYLDRDSDNDCLFDIIEGGGSDLDGNGIADTLSDSDHDGLMDRYDPTTGGQGQPTPDFDGDGRPDYLDGDSDGDGISDIIESRRGDDFTPPSRIDSDDDGIDDICDPDHIGPCPPATDTDSDGTPDFKDLDTDGDGISDSHEAFDENRDGTLDVFPSGRDDDGDGIDDAYQQFSTNPAGLNGDWRRIDAATLCDEIPIARRRRAATEAFNILAQRTDKFAARARACNGVDISSRVRQSHELSNRFRKMLTDATNEPMYTCPSGVCRRISLVPLKRQMERIIKRVEVHAREAKLQAIRSCPPEIPKPGKVERGKRTEDYAREARAALRRLPGAVYRCP